MKPSATEANRALASLALELPEEVYSDARAKIAPFITCAQENHSEMVSTLVKPGEDIIKELTPQMAHLWHMASAAMGEAGEVFDCIKKPAIYGKPLDLDHLVEELGDLEFYLEGIRQALQLDRGDILRANVAKLTKRYGEKLNYSNAAAIARADKNGQD